MTRDQAYAILANWTKTESLLRHARSIELVMDAYAKKYNEDPIEWSITGLLHDADYESFPEEHPNKIVAVLRNLGEEKIAHAISAHYTKWNVPYETLLDKALLACDELTGFIIACCQVRPDGITSLTVKSVKKKLKQQSFAAKVERSEIEKGVELFGVSLDEHISFIIEVLRSNQEVLRI